MLFVSETQFNLFDKDTARAG